MANNKVKFGLSNVKYAPLTINADNSYTFGTPVAMPGAVSLSLDINGEPENFYADDIAYYVINNNMGYDGDLEVALIPESFRTDILHETKDANGVMIEDTSAELGHFALLFEFTGDQKKIRHVLYNCTASRPGIESATSEDAREVKTETLTLKATPLPDGKVKAKTGNDTTTTAYTNWYSAVYVPSASTSANLTALTIGSETLTPTFDGNVTEYTVSTTETSDTVTATAPSGASVVITVNGNSITNGGTATWVTGTNIVKITVTNTATKVYTVTVTKGA